MAIDQLFLDQLNSTHIHRAFYGAFYGAFYRDFYGPSKWPSIGPSTRPSSGPSTWSSRRKAVFDNTGVFFELNKVIFERHTPAGVGLRVADSHTGNHLKDDFTPLETFRGFPSAFRM
ncbi:hypothetical protein Tco_1165886 [Tanacetum coccineum]